MAWKIASAIVNSRMLLEVEKSERDRERECVAPEKFMVQHGVAHQNGKYCVRKELNTSSDISANQQKQHKTSPTFFLLSTHAHTQRGANNDANKDNLIWFSSALAPHTTRSFPERHGTSMKGKSEIIWKSNNSNKKNFYVQFFFWKKKPLWFMLWDNSEESRTRTRPLLPWRYLTVKNVRRLENLKIFLLVARRHRRLLCTHIKEDKDQKGMKSLARWRTKFLSRVYNNFFFLHFPSFSISCVSLPPRPWRLCGCNASKRERKGAEKSIVSWACVGNKFSPKKHIQPRCSCCYVCVSWAEKKTIFSVTPTYRTRWTQHFPVQLVCCVGRVLFHVALSLCEYVKERERIVGARCVRLKWKWKCLHSSHTQKTLRSSCTPKLQHFPTYNKALHSILVIVILPPNWRHFCFQRHKKTFLACLPPFSTSTFDSALIRISFLFLSFREKISRSKSPA